MHLFAFPNMGDWFLKIVAHFAAHIALRSVLSNVVDS
jgi:hypothetical protein